MRTPLCRAAGLLWLLLPALPFSSSAMSVSVRGPKAGPPGGLATSIAGVVVDERERPVVGAEVEAVASNPLWDPRRQQARTDAAGLFLIPEIEEGRPYTLRASRPGFAPALLKTVPQGSLELRLVLRPGLTASGTVVDEIGRPVRGARIVLLPKEDGDTRIYRSTSGADGQFQIADLPDGRFDLRVEHPGHPVLKQENVLASLGSRRIELGRLRLAKGRPLTGQVLDSKGRPLAGVPVWVTDATVPFFQEEDGDPGPAPSATTGPDGRFEIAGAAPVVFVYACPSGYKAFRAIYVPTTPPRKIVLDPAPPPQRLSGRVLDESGRPVPGARVRQGAPVAGGGCITQQRWPACPERRNDAEVTDAGGRFSLELPASYASFSLWAVAPGYLRKVREDIPTSARTLDLVLSRGATIAGQVTGPDGSPAAGARVYAGQDGRAPETRTDAAGRYRLPGVQPGTRELWAEHPELGEARRRLEVSPGAHRLDLTLDGQRERAVSGRVTSPDGEPLAGVRVEASNLSTYTRQDGGFRLVFPRGTLLFYGGTTPVRFSREGYAGAVRTIRASETPLEGLEIRLSQGWPLTGSLLGVEPERALNARVEAARQDGEGRQGRVDRDGAYRIDDLEPGIWTVTATVDWRQKASGTVEIPEGGASFDLKVPALQEVSGRILDPEGNPISGYVKLTGPDGSSRQATSKEDGTFSIEIAEGTYRVEGSGSPWAPTVLEKPVAVGERPVEGLEIRLQPGTILQGRVLGLPAGARATVSLDPDHPLGLPALTEPDGSYRVSGLKPGDWQVEVAVWMEDARRIWRSQVTLAPRETEKNLDLDPGLGTLTLSGRLDSGAEPLSTQVTLLTPAGQPLIEDLLIEDAEGGAFRIPALRPGSYVLRIEDYYRDRVVLKPVELSSDQTVTVDLLHP